MLSQSSDYGTQSQQFSSQSQSGRARRLDPKVINDPIHGHIELCALLVDIIDTPEFQRLRNIKQDWSLYYVFPGVSHNRFEHCIGTCHVATQWIEHLQATQPGIITKEEAICVKIAALCHDLGHGPFSHTYDNLFIPAVKPEGYKTWSHELASIKLFDMLVENNGLQTELEEHGIGEEELHLIKEMIFGPLKLGTYEKADSYQARSKPEKYFLYEIVNNKENGIDVDKFDYIARDCQNVNIANNFDYKRFIKFTRVVKGDTDKYHICVRDKIVEDAYQLFHTRYRLHRNAVKHPMKLAVEAMLADAMVLANNSLTFIKPNGDTFTMAEAINDMEAYVQLDDGIFGLILRQYENNDATEAQRCLREILDNVELDSEDKKQLESAESFLDQGVVSQDVEDAKTLLRRIQQRKVYKLLKKVKLPKNVITKNIKTAEQAIAEGITKDTAPEISANDIVVKIVDFNYGMKKKNPIDNLRFFSKYNLYESFTIKKSTVSYLLPEIFHEQVIYVYVKDCDPEYGNDRRGEVQDELDKWLKAEDGFKEWIKNDTKKETNVNGHTFSTPEKRQVPEQKLAVHPRKRKSPDDTSDDHEISKAKRKLY